MLLLGKWAYSDYAYFLCLVLHRRGKKLAQPKVINPKVALQWVFDCKSFAGWGFLIEVEDEDFINGIHAQKTSTTYNAQKTMIYCSSLSQMGVFSSVVGVWVVKQSLLVQCFKVFCLTCIGISSTIPTTWYCKK